MLQRSGSWRSVLLQSIISWPVWFCCTILQDTHMHLHIATSSLLLWSNWETSRLCQHNQSSHHKYMRLPHWSYIRTRETPCCVTRDMFRLSDRILWQVPWLINPCSCCDFIYHLREAGTHQCCSFLDLWVQFWLVLADRLLIFFRTLSLRFAKCLCHLHTALWTKASLLYACLIAWNVLLVDLSNFGST
jgi:hypothetical protein